MKLSVSKNLLMLKKQRKTDLKLMQMIKLRRTQQTRKQRQTLQQPQRIRQLKTRQPKMLMMQQPRQRQIVLLKRKLTKTRLTRMQPMQRRPKK